jgi:hypothetical protein
VSSDQLEVEQYQRPSITQEERYSMLLDQIQRDEASAQGQVQGQGQGQGQGRHQALRGAGFDPHSWR